MTTLYFNNLYTSDFPFHIAETVLKTSKKTVAHNHDFCEFFIVIQGRLTYNLNGVDYEITEKCLCLSLPEDVHCFQNHKASEDVTFINVAFKRDWLNDSILIFEKEFKLFDFQPWHTVIMLNEETLKMFTSKINILKNLPRDISNTTKTILLKSILIDLLIQYTNDNCQTNIIIPDWLTNACKEMEKPENYVSGLNRFIVLCGRTQEHLSRMMKKYYKFTPSEFINSIRLQQAAKLLIASENNITDIIYDVGFNNASYFNELFKAKYGLTAKEYRKINKRIIDPLI